MLIAGRGAYSWKGSGYVRGGIFDRIALIQGRTHEALRRELAEASSEGHELSQEEAEAMTAEQLDEFFDAHNAENGPIARMFQPPRHCSSTCPAAHA